MDPKPRPNHQRYIDIVRAMTPEQRILKSFELADLVVQNFRDGLRSRFPDAPDEEIERRVREQVDRCRNPRY